LACLQWIALSHFHHCLCFQFTLLAQQGDQIGQIFRWLFTYFGYFFENSWATFFQGKLCFRTKYGWGCMLADFYPQTHLVTLLLYDVAKSALFWRLFCCRIYVP
jgi:hypothetical protein